MAKEFEADFDRHSESFIVHTDEVDEDDDEF
jgi:hypothetical protein